jgi:hypothetical protein
MSIKKPMIARIFVKSFIDNQLRMGFPFFVDKGKRRQEGSPHLFLDGGLPGMDMFDEDGILIWTAP